MTAPDPRAVVVAEALDRVREFVASRRPGSCVIGMNPSLWVDDLAAVLAALDAADTPGALGGDEREAAETSQPRGLGNQEGEPDGNKMGVHPGRTRQDAEGLDRRGLHRGSGVLDRSGSDSTRGRTEGSGRRGLSESTPAGHESAGVEPGRTLPPAPPADTGATPDGGGS